MLEIDLESQRESVEDGARARALQRPAEAFLVKVRHWFEKFVRPYKAGLTKM